MIDEATEAIENGAVIEGVRVLLAIEVPDHLAARVK